MITAQVESLRDLHRDLGPLLSAHYNLLSLHKKEGIPLRPQWPLYFEQEARGEFVCVILRNEGKIIGYWWGNVAPGKHYDTCLTSIMDIWNIVPEFITTVAPKILFDAVHRELKRRGVRYSMMGEKVHRPCGQLFELYGYKRIETTYAKWLET